MQYYQYTWNARAVGNYCASSYCVSSYWSAHHWDSVYMIFLIFHHCFISLAFNGYLCNRAFGNIGQLASNWAINNKVHVPWYQVVIMMRIYLYQCVNLWGYVLALLGSENNYAYIEMEKLVSWGKAVEVTVVSLNHHFRQHRATREGKSKLWPTKSNWLTNEKINGNRSIIWTINQVAVQRNEGL